MGKMEKIINDETRKFIARKSKIELLQRYAKRGDILEWGKVLFPDKFELPFCKELHEYLVSVRGEQYTCTEAPRGHAKTIIKCFLVPLFQSLNEPGTFRHYLNVQETLGKAIVVNLAIRNELERNELLREAYPGLVLSPNKFTEKQFVVSNNGIQTVFTCIGTGESIRGIHYDNIRPDYVIVDDLYSEEDIHNPDSTLKKNNWFWSALYFVLDKSRRNCLHLQGTAINKEDLLYKLRNEPGWMFKTFRAVTNWDKGEVLWAELNSFERLMQDKSRTGSTIFFREMQNERIDEESSIIKTSWLKYYSGDIPNDETVIARIGTCDPSIGEHESNDYTGIATIIKTRLKEANSFRYYIKDVYQEHLSLHERVKLVESWHSRENFGEFRIEAISGFKDFAAEVRRTTNVPVKTIEHVKDKITTLENKSALFENGKVLINKNINNKMLSILIEQLTTNVPSHDDIRDAVLIGLDNTISAVEFYKNLSKM